MKKAILIINPISGTSNKKAIAGKVTSRLAQEGIEVETRWTERAGHATELATEAAKSGEYQMVIAAGGDGTINEIARALCGTGVAMGIIPCGSGNGLARHLRLPMNVDKAIEVVARRAKILTVDHGRINNTDFFCTFGMGFDANVAHKFATAGTRGFTTYLKTTIKEFFSYKPQTYKITIDGRTIEEKAYVVAVCNASQYGNNAYIAPKASMTDGELDLTVIHYGGFFKTALMGIALMTGRIDKNSLVDTYRGRKISIQRSEAGPAHIDGEPIMLEADLDVECIPAQLRIITAEDESPVKPLF